MKNDRLQQVLHYLPDHIQRAFSFISPDTLCRITEIHLRAGRNICVTADDAEISLSPELILSPEDMKQCLRTFTKFSLHRFKSEMSQGYIPLPGGHRVGISGNAVRDESGTVVGISDISSFCVRVAKEYIGCSKELYRMLFPIKKGVLIVGLPARGKTTVLRDLIRLIGEREKVAVIDEKGEIAAVYEGVCQNDLGENTDVLTGFGKAEGIRMAVKNLSPKIVVCDEIGLDGDLKEMREALSSGVISIATLHGTESSVMKKPFVKTLLTDGIIGTLVFLSIEGAPGSVDHIIRCGDEKNDVTFSGCGADHTKRFSFRCFDTSNL